MNFIGRRYFLAWVAAAAAAAATAAAAALTEKETMELAEEEAAWEAAAEAAEAADASAPASNYSSCTPTPTRNHEEEHFERMMERAKKQKTGDFNPEEFNAKKQTQKWIKEDLRTFDMFALQKCWGGEDPVQLVFGRDIWYNKTSKKSEKIGDKLCLYAGSSHPKKHCKQVFCHREYKHCVSIRGFNKIHKKIMTVVGCSKDNGEQCYVKGVAKRRGKTYGMKLGGPIGKIWNSNPKYEDKLVACQCKDITNEKGKAKGNKDLCNGDCKALVKTCEGVNGH